MYLHNTELMKFVSNIKKVDDSLLRTIDKKIFMNLFYKFIIYYYEVA